MFNREMARYEVQNHLHTSFMGRRRELIQGVYAPDIRVYPEEIRGIVAVIRRRGTDGRKPQAVHSQPGKVG